MNNITIGTDPEFFLRDKGQGFISAWGLFPGTKENPYKVDGGAVQVDGCALELNIDPAETAEEFDDNITKVLTQMDEMIKVVSPDLEKVFTPVARFKADYFNTVDQEAKILGCEPDFNIKGEQNVSPDISEFPLRTAAGHTHVGYTDGECTDPVLTNDHFRNCMIIAEHFYNSRSKIFPAKTKEEQERLKYYGGFGAFRPKPYGIELRSYSNRWVENSDSRKHMFNQTKSIFLELIGD